MTSTSNESPSPGFQVARRPNPTAAYGRRADDVRLSDERPADGRSGSILLFRVGETTYGCGLEEAREVIAQRPLTRLPGCPPYVRGLLNMRGMIVTVLDLGVRLDPSCAPVRDGSIMLVRHRERVVGLVIDEVLDIGTIDAGGDAMSDGEIVRGVLMVGDRPVTMLDLDLLITQVLLS